MSEPLVFNYDPDTSLENVDPSRITGVIIGDNWYPATFVERKESELRFTLDMLGADPAPVVTA